MSDEYRNKTRRQIRRSSGLRCFDTGILCNSFAVYVTTFARLILLAAVVLFDKNEPARR